MQAKKMHIFDEIRVWDESNLDLQFKEKWADKLKPDVRGFGYWIWKPYIILKTLESIPEGGLLLYLDAGCHLNSLARKRLLKYFRETSLDTLGIKAFPVSIWNQKKALIKCWTKGDIFDYFACREHYQINDSIQIEAGHIFIRKCDKSVKAIKEWYEIYEKKFSLVDDSPSNSPNFPEFRENRHDQSIFCILFKLRGGTPLPQGDTIPLILINPIWSLRDKYNKKLLLKQQIKDVLFYHAKFICFKLRNLIKNIKGKARK